MEYKTNLHRQIDNVCRWAECSPNNLDVAVHNAKTFLTAYAQPDQMAYHFVGIRIVEDAIPEKALMLVGMATGDVLYRMIELGEEIANIEAAMVLYIKHNSRTIPGVQRDALQYAGVHAIKVAAIMAAKRKEENPATEAKPSAYRLRFPLLPMRTESNPQLTMIVSHENDGTAFFAESKWTDAELIGFKPNDEDVQYYTHGITFARRGPMHPLYALALIELFDPVYETGPTGYTPLNAIRVPDLGLAASRELLKNSIDAAVVFASRVIMSSNVSDTYNRLSAAQAALTTIMHSKLRHPLPTDIVSNNSVEPTALEAEVANHFIKNGPVCQVHDYNSDGYRDLIDDVHTAVATIAARILLC